MVKLFSRRKLTSWSLETATARPREWKFCYCGRYRLSKFSSSFPRWSGIYHPGSVSKLRQLKYGLNQLFCELFAVSLHASHSDQHRSCCEELLRTGTTLSRPPWRVNPSLPICSAIDACQGRDRRFSARESIIRNACCAYLIASQRNGSGFQFGSFFSTSTCSGAR